MSKCGEKEIAEIVAGEATSGVKAILEKLREQSFILGQSDHTIANIAGREHAIFAAQAAGAAAVIGDGNDGGEIADGAFRRGLLIAAADDVLLETAEEGGETGAPAESNNPAAENRRFCDTSAFHERVNVSSPAEMESASREASPDVVRRQSRAGSKGLG